MAEGSIVFTLDLTEIVGAVLSDIEARNDLAIVVQNGTNWGPMTVNFQVEHGNYSSSNGSNILPSVSPPAEGTVNASMYGLGFEAAGLGCYVKLFVGLPSCSWGLILVTAPNKTNKFYILSWAWPKAQQDVFNSLPNDTDGVSTISANDGVYTDTSIAGIVLTVSLTTENAAAATAQVNFALAS